MKRRKNDGRMMSEITEAKSMPELMEAARYYSELQAPEPSSNNARLLKITENLLSVVTPLGVSGLRPMPRCRSYYSALTSAAC